VGLKNYHSQLNHHRHHQREALVDRLLVNIWGVLWHHRRHHHQREALVDRLLVNIWGVLWHHRRHHHQREALVEVRKYRRRAIQEGNLKAVHLKKTIQEIILLISQLETR
jgi:hypothetical protein